MHKINVLMFGPKNFNTSLDELKEHLNFKITTVNDNIEESNFDQYDILFFHEESLKYNYTEKLLSETNKIKILAFSSISSNLNIFTDKLKLPTSIKDLNQIILNSISKKNFNINSSIKIKQYYMLDKNQKKLFKDKNYILLTEKEIQLLELFLKSNKPLSKKKILEEVWKYVSSADTHTVETHIYRLRKKIKSKFSDDDFILNNKKGYHL
jgi:hypothetical protein